jgi:hypothetical protein
MGRGLVPDSMRMFACMHVCVLSLSQVTPARREFCCPWNSLVPGAHSPPAVGLVLGEVLVPPNNQHITPPIILQERRLWK